MLELGGRSKPERDYGVAQGTRASSAGTMIEKGRSEPEGMLGAGIGTREGRLESEEQDRSPEGVGSHRGRGCQVRVLIGESREGDQSQGAMSSDKDDAMMES